MARTAAVAKKTSTAPASKSTKTKTSKSSATKKKKKTSTRKKARTVGADEVPLGPSKSSTPSSKNAEKLPSVGRPRKAKKPVVEDLSGDPSRLTKTQAAVIKDVTSKAKGRSNKVRSQLVSKAKTAGYSEAQLDKVLKYIETEAPLVICFNPDKALSITTGVSYYDRPKTKKLGFEAVKVPRSKTLIDSFLVDTHYRSQFETGISSGSSSAYPGGGRDGWEKKIFEGGYHKGKFDPEERPKYGALNASKVEGGPAKGYGTCMLVLKAGVRPRASVTPRNSSGCSPSDVGTLAHFQHLLLARSDFSQIMDVGLGKKKSHSGYSSYIEAQIHGPVEFDKDVAELIIDQKHKKTKYGEKLLDFAKKYGLEVSYHKSSGYY